MTTASENTADLGDLDLALASLDVETIVEAGEETNVDEVLETISDEVVEEIVEEGSSEVTAADGTLADDLLRDLDIGIEVQESYNAQEGTPADPQGNKAKNAAKAKQAKADKPKKEKKAKAEGEKVARTPRDVNAVPAEFFVLDTENLAATDLHEDIKATTMGLKPAQVKIAEKFDNLFTSLSVNKAPSTYVMIAFKLLDEKKSMTSADLVATYKANGLGEGTARSQCGQIMALFATVGIANRASQVLTLNDKSAIADRLRSLPAS